MAKAWDYTGAWRDYPVEENELWADRVTGSLVMARDLFHGLPEYMLAADMVYVDPPWNTGNVNTFYTKAGKQDVRKTANALFDTIFECVQAIAPQVLFVEMGKQNVEDIVRRVGCVFSEVQVWDITYYKKHPCKLVRGGDSRTGVDYTGMDDGETPYLAVREENPSVVADLCTGRGLIMEAAMLHGKRFVGTEMNKKRLAEGMSVTANRFGSKWGKA